MLQYLIKWIRMEPEETAASSNNAETVSKKNSAPIWEHFTKISATVTSSGPSTRPSTAEMAKCLHCHSKFKTSVGNTTGMHRHLENKHYSKYLTFKKLQIEHEVKKTKKNQVKMSNGNFLLCK